MSMKHRQPEMNISRLPPPLELETRTVIDTLTAAQHLNRQPQTLRVWARSAASPIRPVRIHGRLAWPVAEIRRLLTGGN